MAENKSSKVMQDYEKVNRLIDGLTLFDDDLMSRVFDKNIEEATELILRIILGRKITVIRVNGQEEVRNAEVGGRNITLMYMQWMKMDRKWTLRCREIPKAPISAGQDTSSVLDSKMLKEGQPFKN